MKTYFIAVSTAFFVNNYFPNRRFHSRSVSKYRYQLTCLYTVFLNFLPLYSLELDTVWKQIYAYTYYIYCKQNTVLYILSFVVKENASSASGDWTLYITTSTSVFTINILLRLFSIYVLKHRMDTIKFILPHVKRKKRLNIHMHTQQHRRMYRSN